MTTLFRPDAAAQEIAARFGAKQGEDPWAGGYVAPLNFAPVITAGRDFIAGPRPAGRALTPRMTPRLWGVLPPPGADDPNRRITSLRNPDSPFWIGNLRNSEFRCLVPATSFMEWGAEIDVEGRRNRHVFACPDQPVFAFAGVWKDSEIPTFAILTCRASETLRAIGRDTMPVVLPPDRSAQDIWLHGAWDETSKLLDSRPAPQLREIAPRSD